MPRGPNLMPPLALAGLLALVVSVCAACAAGPSPRPTRSATTPTPHAAGYQRLPVSPPGGIVPSPDGTLLAGTDAPPRLFTLYDLSGHIVGQDTSPVGLDYLWLPDSSGVFVWVDDPGSTHRGPLSIMDRQGRIQPTGLQGEAPALSPDGRWVAAGDLGFAPGVDAVQVVPRGGGAVRTLAQGSGVAFLGWLGGQVAYFAPGGIYGMAPTGGGAHRLVAVPAGQTWHAALSGPGESPDGRVLVVSPLRGPDAMLVGSQLRPLPSQLLLAAPVFWVGPHQALGLVLGGAASDQNELLVVDLLSGAVTHTGAFAPGGVEAVAGPWAAYETSSAAAPITDLHLVNFRTRVDLNLGGLPVSGGLAPLGQERFLLVGNGQAYVVDPALIGASG